MSCSLHIDRRAFLKGLGGVALALPVLDAMGAGSDRSDSSPFLRDLYSQRHVAPEIGARHQRLELVSQHRKQRRSSSSVSPLSRSLPSANRSALWAASTIPNGPKADPHICSDMWLTGAPLQNPKPGTFNSVGLDQVVALQTKQYCRQPSLGAVDRCRHRLPLPYRDDLVQPGRQADPRGEQPATRSSTACSSGDRSSLKSEHEKLQRRVKLVDAVAKSARSLDEKLGKTDRERMDQYMTSLNEVESRLIASERWIDIPLKKQDYSHLNLDATSEGEPAEYYRNMFDLIALAFDADITRSVAFMLNREDGMGISDTFPLKLGLSKTHHNLSHATDKEGQLHFAKYDSVPQPAAGALLREIERLSGPQRQRARTTPSCCTEAAPAPRTIPTTCRL